MRILSFILKSLSAGILFAIGASVFVLWILPIFYPVNMDSIHQETIQNTEQKLGSPCLEVYDNAYAFYQNDIGEIINYGLKGNDWVAYISPTQKEFIDTYANSLHECRTAKYSAERLGLEWPEFQDLQRLFDSLRIYSTSYGSGPSTSKSLKPEALDSLQFEYQNVIRRSKRTP